MRKDCIFSPEGWLAYEGETLYGKPYGLGKVYRADGTILQQGEFDVKGLVKGEIRFSDGRFFEGYFEINFGYGPNYPKAGMLLKNGELCFEGPFRVRRSGLGYPVSVEPEEFGPCAAALALPIEAFSFEDERRAYRDAGKEPPERITRTRRQMIREGLEDPWGKGEEDRTRREGSSGCSDRRETPRG